MRQTLSMQDKQAISDWLGWPLDTDEESLRNHEEFLKCKWVLSDNPNDDDLVEAFDEGYSYPFKLLIDGSIYEATTVSVLLQISRKKAEKFKGSRYFNNYKKKIKFGF